jgi:hypothetical protein
MVEIAALGGLARPAGARVDHRGFLRLAGLARLRAADVSGISGCIGELLSGAGGDTARNFALTGARRLKHPGPPRHVHDAGGMGPHRLVLVGLPAAQGGTRDLELQGHLGLGQPEPSPEIPQDQREVHFFLDGRVALHQSLRSTRADTTLHARLSTGWDRFGLVVRCTSGSTSTRSRSPDIMRGERTRTPRVAGSSAATPQASALVPSILARCRGASCACAVAITLRRRSAAQRPPCLRTKATLMSL